MKKIALILVAVIVGLSVFAQEIPTRPNPPVLVNDFANVFSANEEVALERKLVDFFASTSNQITVVTIADLQGYDIQQFAYKIGETWGVGGAEFNNGVVLLFKPKTANSSGQVNITTGYGLEGAIPDATANQIIDLEMIPVFKQGNVYGGIDAATTVLMGLAQGDYSYQQYAKAGSNKRKGFNPFILFILFFVIFPAIFGRRRRKYAGMGNRSSLPFWLGLGMMSGAGRSHGGMFNDFSSGGGSFGGGSSFGSFGGFGGGGFGGGGASGSW